MALDDLALDRQPLDSQGATSGKTFAAVTQSRITLVAALTLSFSLAASTSSAIALTADLTPSNLQACAAQTTSPITLTGDLTVSNVRACAAQTTSQITLEAALSLPWSDGSWTQALLAAKNQNSGIKPLSVLRCEFLSGDVFIGAYDTTINGWNGQNIAVRGWVKDWGKLDDVAKLDLSDTPVLAGDLRVTFVIPNGLDGTDTFWTRLIDPRNLPEQTFVSLFQWPDSAALDASTDPPKMRWGGTYRTHRWTNEQTLEVTFGDPWDYYDLPIGYTIIANPDNPTGNIGKTSNWPDADPAVVGMLEPIVIGEVQNAPALSVVAGATSPLAQDISANATVAYVTDPASLFAPGPAAVWIDQERCVYSSYDTVVLNGVTYGRFNGLLRGTVPGNLPPGTVTSVDKLIILNGGYGYVGDFILQFSGGGGSGAAGTAHVLPHQGVVVSLTKTASGSRYIGAPAVDPPAGLAGSNFLAICTITNGTTPAIHKRGANVSQDLPSYKYLLAGHPIYRFDRLKQNGVLVNPLTENNTPGYTVHLNDNGKATVTLYGPPTLILQDGNLSLSDTTSIGTDSHTVAQTQVPSSYGGPINPKMIIVGPSGSGFPTSAPLCTFPYLGKLAKMVLHININTAPLSAGGAPVNGITLSAHNLRTQVWVQFGQTQTIFWDDAVNPNAETPTQIDVEIVNTAGLEYPLGDLVYAGVTVIGTKDGSHWGADVVIPVNQITRDAYLATTSTKAGGVALNGQTAAQTIVGGNLTWDGAGATDDAFGSITGTPGAKIQLTRHAVPWVLQTYMALPGAHFTTSPNLALKMGTTYQCNGIILTQKRVRQIASRMAFESGCWLKFIGRDAMLIFRETTFPAGVVFATNRLSFLEDGHKTISIEPLPIDQIINDVPIRWLRDYTKPDDMNGYRGLSYQHDAQAIASQARYGIKPRADLFLCNWVTNKAQADAIRALYMNLYSQRRSKYTFRSRLHYLDVQFGDRARLQDRMAKQVPGEIIGADFTEGNAVLGRMPSCDFEMLGIQEAESMKQVQTKTADYSLVLPGDFGEINNSGAGGGVVITLPAAVVQNNTLLEAGDFYVATAQLFTIRPVGTDQIRVAFALNDATKPVGSAAVSTQAAGKGLKCSTVGSLVRPVCNANGIWDVTLKIGPWDIES